MMSIKAPNLFRAGYTFVVAFTMFLSTISGQGSVTFRPATAYAVGNGPTGLAVADLNGDGKPDLVSINSGSNSVSVLLGNGDGTFQAAKDFPAGNSAWSFGVAVADVNGDGHLDVAVLIPSDGIAPAEIRILTGNGDGSLQAPIVTTLTTQERIFAIVDVNGDKKADLLANLSDPSGSVGVEVLLGNGDGTFQTPKTIVTGQQQFLLAVTDFDHDGKADLVISSASTVQIMLGNGNGTFAMAGSSALPDGYGASSAWTADVNGDGVPDLIVGSSGPPLIRCGIFSRCFTPRASVFLSRGRGDLQAEQLVDAVSPVAVGDFDGDGNIDVAVLVPSFIPAFRKLSIYPGEGNGTFAQPISLPDPGDIAASADLNGDQLTDLILLNSANNPVSVMLNSTPAFRMSAAQSTLTLTAGGSVTDDISLTTVNGFSSAIQLSCVVSGLAPAPTCSLSPLDIPAGANSPTATMTLTAPTQSALTPTPGLRRTKPLYAMSFALAFVGLIPGTKRFGLRPMRWSLGILIGTLLLAAIACGGGSSSHPVPQNQYSVQVTAKSDTLTRTLRVSLTAP